MKPSSSNHDKQLELFQNTACVTLASILATLPLLPASIRYYCEFDEKIFTISGFNVGNSIAASVNGVKRNIDLEFLTAPHRNLIKHVFSFSLACDRAIGTAVLNAEGIRLFSEEELADLIAAGPVGARNVWVMLLCKELASNAYVAAKILLQLCCRYRIGEWSEAYLDLISVSLSLPFVDKFASVKSGEAFLTVNEEALIVKYLDDKNRQSVDQEKVAEIELVNSAMLACSFQFGMRPIQIAMLAFGDMRVWIDQSTNTKSVHFSFRMVKQRSSVKTRPLQRKVKYEWSPVFIELYRRFVSSGASERSRAFGVASNSEAGERIAKLASSIIGRRTSARDLRHTAAQRLVDAGASQEELAEFMGHADVTTGLVYFESSANQAELVNRALGVSDIYQRVVRIAHDKFISPDELAQLKQGQQIGAVPHGIPISGIGGCGSGQPSCPYNPVMSCYGCRKFMPVHEIGIHEQVLADFRQIVHFFNASSRADQHSPAYLQLQKTITEVQHVISELMDGAA